jgi:hypothetical protein
MPDMTTKSALFKHDQCIFTGLLITLQVNGIQYLKIQLLHLNSPSYALQQVYVDNNPFTAYETLYHYAENSS